MQEAHKTKQQLLAEIRQLREELDLLRGGKEDRLCEIFRIAAGCAGELICERDIPSGALTWYGLSEGMLGYPVADFPSTDKAWDNLVHPEDYDRLQEARDRHVEKRRPLAIEYRVRRRDGTYAILSERSLLVRDEEGHPRFWVAIYIDISLQKRMEEELVKARRLESLSALASGVAHDFNNILSAVLGNISLARMASQEDSELSQLLEDAENASLRARNLTDQLLTFSKGGVPFKKPADLGGLVKDAVMAELSGSRCRCDCVLAEGLPLVDVEGEQVTQLFRNLAINAEQAMSSGGTVHVRVEPATVTKKSGLPIREGIYVRVTIQDEGMGISEEHLGRIFDPYFTTKQKGLGLGLTTCFAIARRHDGYITVESRVGVGTAFHVFFPARSEVVPGALPGEGGRWQPIRQGGRVLVMDDEVTVRKVAGRMLSLLGFRSSFAWDGAEMLDLYWKALKSGTRFDLVLVDLTVPGGMSGIEGIHKLLEMDPDVRAIVTSGYANDAVITEYRKYGFRGALVKPYRMEEFSSVILQIMGES